MATAEFSKFAQGPCRVGTGESGLVLSEEGNPAGLSSCSGGLRPLFELCVEPAGLCGRCTGVAVPLRVVPSPTGLPSKRGPGSRVTKGNSGFLLCWPREVQSSIRVVRESGGLLSSSLLVVSEPCVPMGGFQLGQLCQPQAGSLPLGREGQCQAVQACLRWTWAGLIHHNEPQPPPGLCEGGREAERWGEGGCCFFFYQKTGRGSVFHQVPYPYF